MSKYSTYLEWNAEYGYFIAMDETETTILGYIYPNGALVRPIYPNGALVRPIGTVEWYANKEAAFAAI